MKRIWVVSNIHTQHFADVRLNVHVLQVLVGVGVKQAQS